MNTLDYSYIGLAIAAVFVAAIVIIFYRQRTKKTLEKIGDMLDTAINGSFAQGVFKDECHKAHEAIPMYV
ncbi:MAG: hypothetical protein PHZ03_06460 [Syntrophomonas sp.]|nr:hypothetical protein [Syntrophomonas sp.]